MKIESSEIIETGDYRVIIYPASRAFSPKEEKDITETVYDFLSNWQAHGNDLFASFRIEKNQFIVICVDEGKEKASGCSMDALNKTMRQINTKYNLGIFDRMKACFLENGKVKTLSLSDFRNNVKNGEISHNTHVFDFSKNTYLDFINSFLLPLKESWAGKFMLKQD